MSTISEIQALLQNLTNSKITQTSIAEALGTGRSNISTRIKTNSELTYEELKKIEKKFNVCLTEQKINFSDITNNEQFITADRIEINYWPGLPEELKNPKIISCWFDREIVENDWHKEAENLYIVPMPDAGMSNFWYPMRAGNILIIDISQNNISETGVYFATSQNNKKFWIREIQELVNKSYEFRNYSLSGEIIKTYTKQQLADVDFKIVGKVIKNMSFIV